METVYEMCRLLDGIPIHLSELIKLLFLHLKHLMLLDTLVLGLHTSVLVHLLKYTEAR